MSALVDVETWIAEQLPLLIEKYDVPGAAVAVLAEGRVAEHAAGVLSRATGVETTVDSVFQIGSVTKVWTASLVLQLVDEGLLDLEVPIRTYLPEFRIADEAAAEKITTRQLLKHTAGFEGDIFVDTGVGDDCVEKYLAVLHEVPQLFRPDELFSYNNAGYCVLGRLVEVLRGKSYDQCLRDHLITPLGLTHAATDAYQAILHRAAVGHLQPEPGVPCEPAPVWALTRSNIPAGSMLAMTPRDLLGFARLHLDGGVAPDGTRLLEAATVTAMQQPQVALPHLGLMGTHWGLGWELFATPDAMLVGHDGNTIGQAAFLRMVPERGVAIALLTNGGDAFSLYRDLYCHLLAELADVRLPEMPAPPTAPEPIDAARYVGRYSAEVFDIDITQDADRRIWMDLVPSGVAEELGEKPERKELVAFGDDSLIPVEADRGMFMPHVFVGDDGDGRALYLHVGRAVRRAGA
ncbi:beta-lactamase family protein [Nocardioides dongxiaopingii]|uniref:serine hydrolase domain-containing protein n=1 Tax=Nocardioides sp. S-1144 TaxID=2582905 RepID=UPI00116432B5|nr:serine hydrolase domain-containing protein [Nocardioides sp. S-1144]QDH11142.1 beta-lactamase family protein [Nocardioides sp. S-1144]